MNNEFENLSACKNPASFTYDIMGRKTRIDYPDETCVRFSFGFEDGLFLTQAIDQEGKIKKTLNDVNESILTVKEYLNSRDIITGYEYNPMKEIVKVIDDKMNTTTIEYDDLGRKTSINNPDSGRTEYVYDTAGNMIRKITANLKAKSSSINYQYTFNRLDKIDYPVMQDVCYTYGRAGAEFNRVICHTS
jgi:YD repeat-containing protein